MAVAVQPDGPSAVSSSQDLSSSPNIANDSTGALNDMSGNMGGATNNAGSITTGANSMPWATRMRASYRTNESLWPAQYATYEGPQCTARTAARVLLPMALGLAGTAVFIGVPMQAGCEAPGLMSTVTASPSGDPVRVNYWAYTSVICLWVSSLNLWWAAQMLGCVPGCPNWVVAVAVVIPSGLQLGLFTYFHLTDRDDWTANISGNGAMGYFTFVMLAVHAAGVWFSSSAAPSSTLSEGLDCLRSVAVKGKKHTVSPSGSHLSDVPEGSSAVELPRSWSRPEREESEAQQAEEEFLSRGSFDDSGPALLGNSLVQSIIMALYIQCATFTYTFMAELLQSVQKGGTDGKLSPGYYALFIMVSALLKDVLKILGFWLDRGKKDNFFCGYYCAELSASMFYYFFYRDIFDEVQDWLTFGGILTFHIFSEWVAYPFRHTVRVYNASRRFVNLLPTKFLGIGYFNMQRLGQCILLSTQPNMVAHEWVCFGALDCSIRLYAAVYSLLVYPLGYAWLYLGYNGTSFTYFHYVSRAHIRNDATQLVILLVAETLNAVAMEKWFRVQLGGTGAIRRLSGLLESNLFFAFLVGSCLTHGINLWPSYMVTTFCN